MHNPFTYKKNFIKHTTIKKPPQNVTEIPKQYLNFRGLFGQKSQQCSYLADDSKVSSQQKQFSSVCVLSKAKSFKSINQAEKKNSLAQLQERRNRCWQQVQNSQKFEETIVSSKKYQKEERSLHTANQSIEEKTGFQDSSEKHHENLNMSPIEEKSQHTITESEMNHYNEMNYNFSRLLGQSSYSQRKLLEQIGEKSPRKYKIQEEEKLPTFGTTNSHIYENQPQEIFEYNKKQSFEPEYEKDFQQIYEEQLEKLYKTEQSRTFICPTFKMATTKYKIEYI